MLWRKNWIAFRHRCICRLYQRFEMRNWALSRKPDCRISGDKGAIGSDRAIIFTQLKIAFGQQKSRLFAQRVGGMIAHKSAQLIDRQIVQSISQHPFGNKEIAFGLWTLGLLDQRHCTCQQADEHCSEKEIMSANRHNPFSIQKDRANQNHRST